MECRHCLDPNSILTKNTCCTGCDRLKIIEEKEIKVHLELKDVENMTHEEVIESMKKIEDTIIALY